jgi:hypothetical protein
MNDIYILLDELVIGYFLGYHTAPAVGAENLRDFPLEKYIAAQIAYIFVRYVHVVSSSLVPDPGFPRG